MRGWVGLLLCAVCASACDTCGQRFVFDVVPVVAPRHAAGGRVSVMPGGARVALAMIDPQHGPLEVPLRVGSNDTRVVQVSEDGHGHIALVTGTPGKASVFVIERQSGVSGGLDVDVVPAVGLAAAGAPDAGPWRVLEGEVVSAAVVGVQADGGTLLGTGKVALSVDGVLTPELDRSIDGELRQFFSGTPGDGALHAVLGTTVLALPVTVVPKDAVELAVTKTSLQSEGHIELAVSVTVNGHPVHGGACAWSPASLVAGIKIDRTRADRLDEAPDRRAYLQRPDGPFTATCTLAGRRATFSEP